MRLLCETRTDWLKGVKIAVLFPDVCESCIPVIESCLCMVLYHITSEFMHSDINFSITHDLLTSVYLFLFISSVTLLTRLL